MITLSFIAISCYCYYCYLFFIAPFCKYIFICDLEMTSLIVGLLFVDYLLLMNDACRQRYCCRDCYIVLLIYYYCFSFPLLLYTSDL
ncbi:hypothetical protein BCR42DRAFT_412233 [Absidia repens]|uniref:Uncharacterized protein n=1 Tax=Absidia repens TaxID=90262 RepID=A0A1X2IJB9_9FUNG|nr:hypothetical protein BCR42DRAFT_412233 [Absidia repens]